jgi:hypothetical protein
LLGSLCSSALTKYYLLLAVNEVASAEVINGAPKVAMSISKGPFDLLNSVGGESYLAPMDVRLVTDYLIKK